ncbi:MULTISPECIES: glycosyltransferase [Bacillus]|uniref:glycosyltransferase n=1 Tax=Bacillus TaxID=1386 RepID=UPI003211D248
MFFEREERALKWTPYVLNFEWNDDFSAARSFVFQQATKEYIFWLDADNPENKGCSKQK